MRPRTAFSWPGAACGIICIHSNQHALATAMPIAYLQSLIDPQRAAQLEALALRERAHHLGLDRITRLTARVLQAPAAFVSLVESEVQVFLSQRGLPAELAARELPIEHSLCAHALANNQPFVLSDARQDERAAHSDLVTRYGIVAYAGVPLVLSDGLKIGALCVVDFQPRAWTDDEIGLLRDLAAMARTDLELHATSLRNQRTEYERDVSQRFLQQVFEATPDIIYVYDLDEQRNVYSNNELSRVLGYEEGELRETERGAVIELTHPEDLQSLTMRNERLIGAPVGTVSENEFRMRHADGTYRWLRSRETILEVDPHGQPKRMLGVAQDITRRRHMEMAQRETVQRLTLMRRVDIELLRTLDLQGALTVAMDAALRVTNASDAFIGLIEDEHVRIASVAGSYERDTLLAAYDGVIGRALRSGRPELIQDVQAEPDYIAWLPGTRAQMVLPLVYRDRPVGVMVLDSRRTDRLTPDTFEFMKLIIDRITVSIENALLYQLAQDRLTQVTALYERVRQLEQLKTDMIRLAAHDLRGPLNVVLMHCDLLLESADVGAAQRRSVEEMRSSASRMDRIVADILSLQRIEAIGNVDREPISLSRLVELAAAHRQGEARDKGLTFTVLLPGSSVVVEADAAQLQEALDNLIGNAVKYTPKGGSVTLRLVERGGNALFEVEDTGPGIPDELQTRLFTPFFRARTPETAEVEGTGLGLHLVKNIIERHHGRMRFQSTYGRGSMFGFEMPAVRTGVLKPVS